MDDLDLNAMAARVHAANRKWWFDLVTDQPLTRNRGELCMLIVSELAEAMEGERKNIMDDHLPHRLMAEVEMADTFIRVLDYAGGFEYELGDYACQIPMWPGMNRGETLLKIVGLVHQVYYLERVGGSAHKFRVKYALCELIRAIRQYCSTLGYDLLGAYEDKLSYNATRLDHQKEARLAAGGKKF
jgi:uncharacterized protein (DUF2249 family)